MADEGYKKLEIWKMGHDLAVRVHAMSLNTLPKLEMFEEGSQIRRSSKRVPANIVEGYAQRKYRDLYLTYLYRSLGSSDETIEHLELLSDTGSLSDEKTFCELRASYQILSRKIGRFIIGVEQSHSLPSYLSKIKNQKSKIASETEQALEEPEAP